MTTPAEQQAMNAIPKTDSNIPAVRAHCSTGNPYEKRFGYHRAVRRGPFIFVSGTTAVDSATQELQAPGDASAQAALAMKECISAVKALHGKRDDICRVRMFVARHEDTGAVGEQLKEHLGAQTTGDGGDYCAVAATMIVVGSGAFVDPEMLVEVEVDAVVL